GWSWRRRRGRRGRPKQRFDAVKRKRSQQQKQHAHDNARHRVRLLFGWPCEGELRATSRAHGVDTFREINHLLTVRLLAVASVEASIIGGHKSWRFSECSALLATLQVKLSSFIAVGRGLRRAQSSRSRLRPGNPLLRRASRGAIVPRPRND